MHWPPAPDWGRAAGWAGAAIGPAVAAAAVGLLWVMSTSPAALARVPDVTGLPATVAQVVAADEGLRTTGVRVVRGGVAGTVVGQMPRAGAFVRKGTVVTVAVTVGGRQVVVPQVAGMPLDQARRVLRARGLVVGAVVFRAHPAREPGRVVRMSPAPGRRVDEGTAVELEVPFPSPG